MSKKVKTKGNRKLPIMAMLYMTGFIPIVFASTILTGFASRQLKSNLAEETFACLKAGAISVEQYFIWDIRENILSKDEVSYEFIDSLEVSDMELTFFLGDEQYITSIRNQDGTRNEGTTMDPAIWKEVSAGNEYHDEDVVINGETYYGYYYPVKSEDGEVIGAAFAGEKAVTIGKAAKILLLKMYGINTLVLTIFGVIIFILSRAVKKPLVGIAENIGLIASGDLNESRTLKSLLRETTSMINSTVSLREKLNSVVEEIDNKVEILNSNAEAMEELASNSSSGANQISLAMEELATTATTLAKNVQEVSDMTIKMEKSVAGINDAIGTLNSTSEEMQAANEKSIDSMNQLLSGSSKSAEIIEKITSQVQNTNDAVAKISEAVDLISSITSQTNLLSLNASIEAARAGENGRGFAVVADEIKKLSEQSAASADTIRGIANEILHQSNESVELVGNVKQIVTDEQVSIAQTQGNFNSLKIAIDSSIREIEAIDCKVKELDEIKVTIVENVNDLSAISEESAASNQEVSANVISIAESMTGVSDGVSKIKDVSDQLTESMTYFKK